MSDDGKDNDPDYEPECSTVNVNDLELESSGDETDEPKKSHRSVEDFIQEKDSDPIRPCSVYKTPPKPRRDRRTSLLWTKFTILSRRDKIASCNICDQKLYFKSTSHNLKKHLERKHKYFVPNCFAKRENEPKLITPTPRPKLSELAGISEEGITLKVVGENGEEEHFQVVGEMPGEVQDEVEVQDHGYSLLDPQTGEMRTVDIESDPLRIEKVRSLRQSQSPNTTRDPPPLYRPQRTFTPLSSEKVKRQRIMDLQLECLENKKYNMQLEALLMEHQLNLPRSVFTETLCNADTQTRGTQTEVGGSDTRVFYISERNGGRPIQQLFAFQDL